MTRLRYYAPSVGSDHIPNRWRWLDTAIPLAICATSFAILIATTLRLFQ